MGQELIGRSGNRNIGWIQHSDEPPDLLTGTCGAYTIYCSDLCVLYCGELAKLRTLVPMAKQIGRFTSLLILTSTSFL